MYNQYDEREGEMLKRCHCGRLYKIESFRTMMEHNYSRPRKLQTMCDRCAEGLEAAYQKQCEDDAKQAQGGEK